MRSCFALTEPEAASLGPDEHLHDGAARRRVVGAGRSQVVDLGRDGRAVRDRHGGHRPGGAAACAGEHGDRAARRRGLRARATAAAARPRARATATASCASTRCACPRTRCSAGAAQGFAVAQARLGPGADPSLHARGRRGRAGVRADVPARELPGDARRAPRRRSRWSRTGSRRRGSRSTRRASRSCTPRGRSTRSGKKAARQEIAQIKVQVAEHDLRRRRPRDPGARRARADRRHAAADVRPQRAGAALRRWARRGPQGHDREARARAVRT